MQKETITKEDCINKYKEENGTDPTWTNKLFKEMTPEEINEYSRLRKKVERQRKGIKEKQTPNNQKKQPFQKQNAIENVDILDDPPEGYYSKEKKWSNEEKLALVQYTAKEAGESALTPEEKAALDRQRKQDTFISEYIKNHKIRDQEHMNYVVEHDERFRLFLEKSGRLKEIYTGRHLEEIQRRKQEVEEELVKEAKNDKGNKILKKFNKITFDPKKLSNEFKDSKKELDLTPYRNKKLEAQGYILCMYLRKNGLMELRYVKMDEVGQIKVDGYVYHERDATYRFGKKNDPVLVIIEGSLVPINKETLKENLGFESAEAQKLVIKGIEQAEVVKAGGIEEHGKKPFTPNKWIIAVVIIVIIGVYAFLGGFK